MNTNHAHETWRSAAYSAAITTTFLVGVMLLGVFAAMPTTVLTQHWTGKARIGATVPESWQFFTRDPETVSYVLYRDGEHAHRLDTLPQSSASNLFGLSRNQRSQDTEKAILASKASQWFTCGGMAPNECLRSSREEPAQKVPGLRRAPNFCGDALLAIQKPRPFVYRNLSSEEYSIDKVAHLRISCATS